MPVRGYGQDQLQTHYCSHLVQCCMGMERDYGTARLQIMCVLCLSTWMSQFDQFMFMRLLQVLVIEDTHVSSFAWNSTDDKL